MALVALAVGCGADQSAREATSAAPVVANHAQSVDSVLQPVDPAPPSSATAATATDASPKRSVALVRVNVRDTNLKQPGALPDERLLLGGARALLPEVAKCWATTASTARWVEVEWQVDDLGAPLDVKAHPVFQPPAGRPPLISEDTLTCVAAAARSVRFTASSGRKPARVIALYGVNLPELAGQPVANDPFYPNPDGSCSEPENCPANKRCEAPEPRPCPREAGIAKQPENGDADRYLVVNIGGAPGGLGQESLGLSRRGTVCGVTLQADYAINDGVRTTRSTNDLPCAIFDRFLPKVLSMVRTGPHERIVDSNKTFRSVSSVQSVFAQGSAAESAEWSGENKANAQFDKLVSEMLAEVGPFLDGPTRRLGK